MANAITGTHSLETRIMDLWEQGRSKQQIALELGLPLASVNRVFGYMIDTGEGRRHRDSMIAGSVQLAAAINQARAVMA